MKKYFLSLFVFLPLFFGCTQKVSIQSLQPAPVDRITQTKNIAVMRLENDRVGLSLKIESNLAQFKIKNEPFFTMVSRSDINQVIQEQKIQNSGLVHTQDILDVGNLIGAQALISGRVGNAAMSDTHYYERRARCADKKCKELYYYNVRCKKRVISLAADIKIVDIAKGDIIYADSISKAATYRHCSDETHSLPSKNTVAHSLASQIADTFTQQLTPYYKYFEVELLEKPDLDYTSMQKRLLESSLEYIKHKRYLKAEKLLVNLIDSTAQQSYVAFYNLGVVKEAQGDYEKAKTYYEKADDLTIEPIEVINIAYLRINAMIKSHQMTKQQLQR